MVDHIHIGLSIYEELQKQGRSVVWLAQQLNTSRMTCYRIFHCYSIDTQVLYRISVLLKKNFFAEYSQKLQQEAVLCESEIETKSTNKNLNK